MKILRVITRLNIGGPSHQAQHLHRELTLRGHECTLIHGPVEESEGDHCFLDETHRILYQDLGARINLLRDLKCLRRLIDELSLQPFDVLHTHTSKAGLLGRAAALLSRKKRKKAGFPPLKVLHTYHGHVFSGYFGPFLTKVVLILERWLARHSDHLITLSPRLQREISTHLKVPASRIQIVPLGLELKPFLSQHRTINPNEDFRSSHKAWIGWVGRLVSIKNPHAFLSLARVLVTSHPNIGFLIIGDGPMRKSVESSIAEMGLKNNVYMTGWRNDLPQLLPALDILLNTSSNEGTPVSLLEAMASGVPTMAPDVGGCRDLLHEGEPTVVYTTGTLSQQKDLLLKWIDEDTAISQTTREKIVSHHSIERLADDLEKLYTSP